MRILIYGGGAVGLGLASCLLKSGVQTDILGRLQTVGELRQSGLLRDGIFGEFFCGGSDLAAIDHLDQAAGSCYDAILICTKSHGTLSAAEDLRQHPNLLSSEGIFILAQNGWGNADIFARFFPKDQIYNARVITGFTRPQPNRVTITVHADDIHIGSLFGASCDKVRWICDKISEGGIPCIPTETIEKDLWAKMLYNCALNPLGAILDAAYGELAAHESTRKIMDAILEEVFTVMQFAGYSTYWDCAKAYLAAFYETMVPPTAEHRSSTLQDLKAGKKTEIDALNGQILLLAERHGLQVPWNREVYEMIRFIESRADGTG